MMPEQDPKNKKDHGALILLLIILGIFVAIFAYFFLSNLFHLKYSDKPLF